MHFFETENYNFNVKKPQTNFIKNEYFYEK